MRESVFLSIYRVYNKRVYKGKERNVRGVRKVAERKVKNVRERVFPLYSIIEIGERKRRGKDRFIIYRTLVIIRKQTRVLSANICSIYHTFECVPTFHTFVCTFSATYEYTLI